MKITISISADIKYYKVGQKVAVREEENSWFAGTITKVGRKEIEFTANDGNIFDYEEDD